MSWDMKQEHALIVDGSHWTVGVDYQELRRGGVVMGIWKDDAAIADHFAQGAAAGLLNGAFGWISPLMDGKQQALEFLSHCDALGAKLTAGDAEQDWISNDEYMLFNRGKLAWSQVRKVAGKQIVSVVKAYMAVINEHEADTGIPGPMYSRNEWLNQYFKGEDLFLTAQKDWSALYTLKKVVKASNWAQVRQVLPTKSIMQLDKFAKKEPDFWQVNGDCVIVPGMKSPIEIDLFRGGNQALFDYLHVNGLPAPAPLPYDAVTLKAGVPALNVRPGPADFSRSLRMIVSGETVRLKKQAAVTVADGGKWRELWGESGWVNQGYLNL